jgi:hypothetical protein
MFSSRSGRRRLGRPSAPCAGAPNHFCVQTYCGPPLIGTGRVIRSRQRARWVGVSSNRQSVTRIGPVPPVTVNVSAVKVPLSLLPRAQVPPPLPLVTTKSATECLTVS